MTLIDLAEKRNERSWNKAINSIAGELSRQFNHADEVATEFIALLEADPKKAVRSINSFIDRSRNYKPNAKALEAMVGGPHEALTAPFFRVTGAIYPSLEKEDRLAALQQCLKFLDGLNYVYSQQHIEYIDEPWLAGDIVNNRSIYSPGFKEYTQLVEGKSWGELSDGLEGVKSKFWLAMAVSRVEYATLEVRVKFGERFPNIVDRTQDVIAWWMHTWAQISDHRGDAKYEVHIEKGIMKYDPEWHDAIRQKIPEDNYVLVHDCTLYGAIPDLREP